MTDTDLWQVAREWDEQWPADTKNDAARMARLALSERERVRRQIVLRDVQHDRRRIAETERDSAEARVAAQGRVIAAVEALAEDFPHVVYTWMLKRALGDADTLAEVKAQERAAVLDEYATAFSRSPSRAQTRRPPHDH